jgi:hypothetical protein
MKRLLFFLGIVFGLNASAQTAIVAGNVSGNWTLAGSPYLIQGNIIVPNDSTLTIDPGVMISFQGHYKLFCNGRIIAVGTSSKKINFTGSNSPGWEGIRFDSTPATNDTSLFTYCIMQHGSPSGTGNDIYGGAFFFNGFSKSIISYCTITNNCPSSSSAAIYCISSSPKIKNNSFSNNGATSINCQTNSNPLIENNTMTNGSAIYIESAAPTIIGNTIYNNTQGYGGISCFSSSAIIKNNIIKGNINSNGAGGGGILLESAAGTISNNIISNNSTSYGGGGISCHYCSTDITDNVVVNNQCSAVGGGTAVESGGGIYIFNSSPILTNNTICNNTSNTGGGGISCIYNSNPVVTNCILYGNLSGNSHGNNIYLDDNASDPSIIYCNLQGNLSGIYKNGNPYTGIFNNNIDTLPVFVSPSLGSGTSYNGSTANWALNVTSPCINAGDPSGIYPSIDIAGNPRVNNSIIDIGAYEYQSPADIINYNLKDEISIYPNPSNGIFNLSIGEVDNEKTHSIEIYNLIGECVYRQNIISATSKIDVNSLPNGVYNISLTSIKGTQNKRIVIVK